MGEWAEAIKSADAAIGLDDANPWAYQTLGWALQHGDAIDARRSMSAYAAALALIPDDPWAHKGLANAQYLLNHDDAATNYQRAVDHLAHVSARDSDLNALLGWCLYRLSRYAEAIDCLQRGVDDPDQRPGALVDLMMAYLALGDNDQAWQTYGAVESELRTLSEPRRRAIGWVGLDNLRTGIRRELSDNQQAPNVLESLSQFLSG
jgi:tetratricopeptide (TPR) repeat protein